MTTVPVFQEYMNPILAVLRRHGTALAIEELDRLVIHELALAPEVATLPHDPERPDRSEVAYRIAWARTYLKKAHLLMNPKRGLWGISETGQAAGEIDSYALATEIGGTYESKSASADSALDDDDDDVDEELLAARVSEELASELREVHSKLAMKGGLLPPADAARCYRRFREEFGPDVLANLDGEALLQKMHARKEHGHDSLMYWLEFKDDEEFLARFGSIAGGSALKFGIYQAAETGYWMTGSSKKQVQLSVAEAAARARVQRDQLVGAAAVLRDVSSGKGEIDYSALQESLEKVAPDVAESTWGHKYLSLIFPTLLPPIHGTGYEEHQLYKLLKLPGRGRYENARIFAGVAKQLGMNLHDLAATLHQRNGGSHRYWRVGTTVDSGSEWDRMRLGGFAAIGWPTTGNLSAIPHDQAGRAEIRQRLAATSKSEPSSITKAANQIFNFIAGAQPRDVVLAMEGGRVRGIGQVAGGYSWAPDDGPFPHRRAVKWLRFGEWKLPRLEGMRTTFVPINKPLNIIETEARLLGTPVEPGPVSIRPNVAVGTGKVEPAPLPVLDGIVARIDTVLQRKRQVILHGPPGTGKTYWAERAVEELAARAWFSKERLDPAQRDELRAIGAIEMCSFHPAYGYEDFLEGYRADEKAGQLTFALQPGIFKALCQKSTEHPKRPYFLIIDEINRGDIPRIFGELLTVLEREKRGKPIRLPLSRTSFAVPDNVYVIGTMNTADRSIALLDAALRRRFGFVELVPDSGVLKGASVGGLPLGPWLDELNRRIVKYAGRDARHLRIGHSYLMPSGAPVRELARFVEILRDDIIPLLEEYCYEDFEALERILGKAIAQRSEQRIDSELFSAEKHQDLVDKLLTAFEGITAIEAAIASDADEEDLDAPESSTELEDDSTGGA